jgi:integrase
MTALIHATQTDSPRSHALVLLLGMNGLRISEVLDADVEDLTTERGHRVLLILRARVGRGRRFQWPRAQRRR